jgi:hypothetical protein
LIPEGRTHIGESADLVREWLASLGDRDDVDLRTERDVCRRARIRARSGGRGLKACFEVHGFPLPDPPSLKSFIASGATNWSPLSQLIDLHPSASDADAWDQLEAECEALGLTFDEFRDS